MNPYFKKLEKIEFIITYACTGNCRHCSQGDHKTACGRIDATKAADAVIKIASEHEIKTVMTFGGEPLLYPEAVYKIMKAAKEMNVAKRQVITSGYFSKDADTVKRVAMELADYEEGGCDGKQGIINIGTISSIFEPGALITIAELKALGLINKKVRRIKVLADGVLDKPLTIKAEAYSVQAIKMIELTGGKVIILRSPKEMERLRLLREQQQQTQPTD